MSEVPVEATEEMGEADVLARLEYRAGLRRVEEEKGGNIAHVGDYTAGWSAMLAARPPVPEEVVEEWAKVMWNATTNCGPWETITDFTRGVFRAHARALITHLGGTVG